MALVKPFVNKINAFDATMGSNGNIVVGILGGDTINSINYAVYELTTNTLILSSSFSVSDTLTSDIRNFTVPNITGLTNNATYFIVVQAVKDNGDSTYEYSPKSTNAIFDCYITPTLTIQYSNLLVYSTLANNTVLLNSKFFVRTTFNKVDLNSPAVLNVVNYKLYGILNSTETLVFEGNNSYTSPFEQYITGLAPTTDFDINNSVYETYKLVVSGTTVDGFEISKTITGLLCHYSLISSFGNFSVSNKINNGYIEIQSTYTDIQGESQPTPPDYITNILTLSEINLSQSCEFLEVGSDYTGLAIELIGDAVHYRLRIPAPDYILVPSSPAEVGELIVPFYFTVGSANDTWGGANNTIAIETNGDITIYSTDKQTLEEWQTYLASYPLYMEYRLTILKDRWVKWEDKFSLLEPYTLRLWGRCFSVGETIAKLYSNAESQFVELVYNADDTNAWIELYAYTYYFDSNGELQQTFPYYIESDTIALSSISETVELFIGVQQNDNSFNVDFELY